MSEYSCLVYFAVVFVSLPVVKCLVANVATFLLVSKFHDCNY